MKIEKKKSQKDYLNRLLVVEELINFITPENIFRKAAFDKHSCFNSKNKYLN